MHFMLSREVVLGPRGKKYFRDKVKDFKSVRPAQLFNELRHARDLIVISSNHGEEKDRRDDLA